MAFPLAGRDVDIYRGDVSTGDLIAGCQSKSATINNEPIDITSDDDDGFRTLLADPATRSMDMSVEGVTKDTILLEAATGATSELLTGHVMDIPGVGTIEGDFYLNSFELGAPTAEAVTFTASLQSSGEFTFTPETP